MSDQPQRLFYCSRPVPESHPDRLATIARLYGLNSPDIENCRVMEIGCADGGNLIPLAEAMPAAEFVGVDLATDEIAAGNRRIAELGIVNARLEPADLRDLDDAWGRFDFILCHGVFSWVPADVRERLLEVCSQRLGERGVVYLNINTHPGWNVLGQVREVLRRAAAGAVAPADRIAVARRAAEAARAILASQPAHGLFRPLLEEFTTLGKQSDDYLYHAFLEVVNEPVYFDRFAAGLGSHGLQYLGDARAGLRWSRRLAPANEQRLSELASDPIAREQVLDLLNNRASRFCLLCSAEHHLADEPSPAVLDGLYLAAALQRQPSLMDEAGRSIHVFSTAAGQPFSTASEPFAAALDKLSQAWPEAVKFEDLPAVGDRENAESAANLRRELLEAYAAELIEVNVAPPRFTTQIGDRPRASDSARHDAAAGPLVVNLKHRSLSLNELGRALLQRLDGRNSQAELARWLFDSSQHPACPFATALPRPFTPLAAQNLLANLLRQMAQNAFLLPGLIV